MKISIGISDMVWVEFDDEITDHRPPPEVVDDYLTRLRGQAIEGWMALPEATVEADAETD